MSGTSDLALEVCVQQPLADICLILLPWTMNLRPCCCSPSTQATYIRGLRALMNYNLVQGCEAML